MSTRNCYFRLYLRGVNLTTGERYPEIAFNGYSKREAIARYKEQCGIKYRRNIVIFEV